MFEKLIVSEPEGADFKNRRGYFMVSSAVVGALFLTAVVISIYSADIGLGNGGFELTEMLPPVAMAPEAPEPPKPRATAPSSPERSTIATRSELIESVNQPTAVLTTTSTAPNRYPSIPDGAVEIGPRSTDPSGSGRPDPGTGPGNTSLSTPPEVEENTTPEPPPVKPPPVKPPTKSLGVVNGIATSLPKPIYPAPAIAVNAQGKVGVQVLIDENGRVISAKAVSGNPLLRNAAETAARNARFTPTLLSRVPVKVTGVIVYNFTRS